MDWELVRKSICDGRGFAPTGDGFRVLSDTMMPSGAVIHVHFQARTDHLMAHDGGAAFDELNRFAVEIGTMKGVRAMLAETNFSLTDDGVIWRERFSPAQASDAISMIADASVRAAAYMMARGKVRAGLPLDQRLRDAMRSRFPQGRPNFTFAGKHRQHTFDFGVVEGDRTILLQAVGPEQSSIASAIVKSLDAKAVEGSNVVSIFVFDPADHWTSGSLNMLDLGGRGVEISAVDQPGFLKAA